MTWTQTENKSYSTLAVYDVISFGRVSLKRQSRVRDTGGDVGEGKQTARYSGLNGAASSIKQ